MTVVRTRRVIGLITAPAQSSSISINSGEIKENKKDHAEAF